MRHTTDNKRSSEETREDLDYWLFKDSKKKKIATRKRKKRENYKTKRRS